MRNTRAILGRVAPGAATVILTGMAVAAAGGLFPAAASAATPSGGHVVVQPAGGNDETQISLVTSGPCGQGTNVVATVYGSGFGRFGQIVVANSPIATFPTTSSGGMIIPLAGNMRYFANLAQVPVELSGAYRFVVACRTATGLANLRTFTSGPVTFTAAGPTGRSYHVVNPVGVPTVQVASAVQPNPYGTAPTSGSAGDGSSSGGAAGGHGSSGTGSSSQASQGDGGHGAPGAGAGAGGASAEGRGTSAGGSSGGGAVLTILVSILGGMLVLALAVFRLARRRRPAAGPSLRRANLGSSTH